MVHDSCDDTKGVKGCCWAVYMSKVGVPSTTARGFLFPVEVIVLALLLSHTFFGTRLRAIVQL